MSDTAALDSSSQTARGTPALVVSGTLTLDTIERAGVIARDVPGGSALYAAAAGSILLPTRIVGTVGSDFPFDAVQPLFERGVDRSSIEVLDGATFRWHARYGARGDERVTVSRDPGVSSGRLPPLPANLTAPVALVLGSTDPRVQAHVRAGCADPIVVGLDSMRHWWDTHAAELRALLARVDIVFLDDGELAVVSDAPDVDGRVRQMHALGPHTVVLKRGSRGASVHRRDATALHIGAVATTRVVDPTGAGDAFAGAYVAARAHAPERGDAHALRFATAVASCAVEAIGLRALHALDPLALRQRMDALTLSGG